MIIYSVASKQSFEMARIIRDKILNHLVSPVPRPAHHAAMLPPQLQLTSTLRLSNGSPLSL
jgi:hypothetical protein